MGKARRERKRGIGKGTEEEGEGPEEEGNKA